MYNKVILIGRLVADPELKTTPNGVNTCSFRIAVNRPYQKDKERKADFITIVAWRAGAEFVCRYFAKGSSIGIEGAIQTRDYVDKDGNKHYITEVAADRLFFVGGKSAGETAEDDEYEVIDDNGDLPF